MKILLASIFLCLACTATPAVFAAEKVGFINVDGAIGPATASYISRSIEEARAQNVQCLVIQLNTPGGLLDLPDRSHVPLRNPWSGSNTGIAGPER